MRMFTGLLGYELTVHTSNASTSNLCVNTYVMNKIIANS